MTDTVDPATRNRIMASIRSTETGPEVALRRELRALGVRGYRKNARLLPVYHLRTADVVFFRERVAVFVHGCFWHRCPDHYRSPKTRTDFWDSKTSANRDRDLMTVAGLLRAGWRALEFWEHEVAADAAGCAARVRDALAKVDIPPET
jgi:DNA mismatch endonuclease (patch repair protein)